MTGITRIDYSRQPEASVGIGMIGYGFMGKVHSNAYVKIPYSFDPPAGYPRLAVLCGRNEAKATAIARRLGYAACCTDWKDLVKDPAVQIVDVCTPDNEHFAPSLAALQAGKHVICEKPLTMSVADAKALADTARKAGVKHMLCHNYRFIPAVRLARDLIDKGVIGRIYQFRAVYLQDYGHDPASPLEDCWYATGTKSGVLLGIGSHIIDMARFLAGEIVGVSGLARTWNTVRRTRTGAEQQVTADEGNAALVEFAGGAIGTLESSGVATGRRNFQGWEANGSKGSMVFDLEDPNNLQVFSDDGARELRGFANVSVTDAAHPLRTVYLPSGHNAGWEYGHVHALHHFVDCVLHGRPVAPHAATFEDGYRIQAIMEAIKESSRSGRKVTFDW